MAKAKSGPTVQIDRRRPVATWTDVRRDAGEIMDKPVAGRGAPCDTLILVQRVDFLRATLPPVRTISALNFFSLRNSSIHCSIANTLTFGTRTVRSIQSVASPPMK